MAARHAHGKDIRDGRGDGQRRCWITRSRSTKGLHRIADSFSDSEEEYKTSVENSIVLRDFINGTDRREEIKTYLSVCEITQDEKIEQLRERLLQVDR